MLCIFAVFFKRPEPFKPVRFPRRQIVEFINQGQRFAKEPTFKPPMKSTELNDPQWFQLEVRLASSKTPIQIRWSDWNHGFPFSVEPLRNMAQGMALDAHVSDPSRLVKTVAESTDAIGVYAAGTDLSDECQMLLDDLQGYLLKKVNGVLFIRV